MLGKSGSGKSTLARIICRLDAPNSGQILFYNNIINKKNIRQYRKDITMVFQDAYSSMNLKWKIKKIIEEPINNFLKLTKVEKKQYVEQLISSVGLDVEYLDKYIKELSGGQQKRISIARAIACKPKLIIFDESFSGLDVETKRIMLDLLLKLKKKYCMSYLFITHDEQVANYVSDEIIDMRYGIINRRKN